METTSVLRILSVVGAFCAAALAFPEAMGAMARMRVVDRASHAASSNDRTSNGPIVSAVSRGVIFDDTPAERTSAVAYRRYIVPLSGQSTEAP
jgi:hypothetical protein